MAVDEENVESLDQPTEAAPTTYKPEGNEMLSTLEDASALYKAEQEQRKLDESEGKRRDTGSYEILQDLGLSIFDGDKRVAGKNTGPIAKPEVEGDVAASVDHAPESKGEPQAEAKQEPTAGDDPGDGSMGAVGGRFRDAGVPVLEKQDMKTNQHGEISEYTLPDGRKFEIDWHDSYQGMDDSGNPIYKRDIQRIIYPDSDGRPHNYVNSGGKWVDLDQIQAGKKTDPDAMPINFVSVDEKGNIKIVEKEAFTESGQGLGIRTTRINKDGSFSEEKGGSTIIEIDKDGTVRQDSVKTQMVKDESGREFRSRIGEERKAGQTNPSFVVTDDQGHKTSIDVQDDKSGTLKRGDKTEHFDKVERQENGDLKLTNKDGTLEVKQDGTSIKRDKQGHVTEITNSDNETTKFTRAGKGVSEVKLFDGQGNEIKQDHKEKVVEIDDKTGTYKVEGKDGHKIERKADGTERELDKEGKQVESRADKLMGHFRRYTPEQQRQLRQDLADIDKMPAEQKEKVYASLEKIAYNDESSDKVRLTSDQARELTASLAHQVAHPESIYQGDKMTCVLASTEQTLAKTHPEVYADMVAKLATEGKYTAADGTTIEARTESDGTALGPKTDAYGQRTYTSELFQNASAQLGLEKPLVYKSFGPFEYGEGALRPYPKGVNPSFDTGERTIDPTKDPPEVMRFPPPSPPNGDHPAFDGDRQAMIMNRIVPGEKYEATSVTSTEQLGELAKQGLPLNIGIHLGTASDFSGMSGSEGASGGGFHAITITHIEWDKYDANGNPAKDAKPTKVYYDNTAGGADTSYPNGEGVDPQKIVNAMNGGEKKMKAVAPAKKS